MESLLRGQCLAVAARVAALALLLGTDFAAAHEVAPNQKMLWSCYMICWPLNRDWHGFYDRPLERPPADGSSSRLVDLRRAIDAGVDALSVDLFITDRNALPAFDELVRLIKEHDLPLQLSPMFDGLADPGLSLHEVAAKIESWFHRFAAEPCVVRTGGKPVLFTFGASSLKPAEWQDLWQLLHGRGCDGFWIGELSHYLATGASPDFKGAAPWLDLFPAANSFNVHSPERAAALIAAYQTRAPAGPVWVAPVSMGYWRPEIAVYTSQRGTGLFRDTWKAIREGGVAWVQQSTWNDFGENHHLMPSENRGTVFLELNRYLSAQWKGQSQPQDKPRLLLSQRSEVLVGEESPWELLAILPASNLPVTVSLRLLDAQGRSLHIFPGSVVNQSGLQATDLVWPVHEVPPGRLLYPEAAWVDSQGQTLGTIRGPATIVTSGTYHPERNHSWLHTSAGTDRPPLTCSLELPSVSQPEIVLRAESRTELADVEILRNGCQLLSLRRDHPQTPLTSPVTWKGTLPLNRRGQLDWGTYAARAITRDGQAYTSPPAFVDLPAEADITLGDWRFDADSVSDVLDGSPWLHDGRLGGRPRRKPWFPKHVTDPWGGSCLEFDGLDDRVLLEGPIVPPDSFTVECWIKPDLLMSPGSGSTILFATANAAVVLSLDRENHLQATRKSDGRWHKVRDPLPATAREWQHAAATYDGSVLRLYRNGHLTGEAKAPGQGTCGQVAVGYNSVTNDGFYRGCLDELRLSSKPLQPEEFGPHSPLSTRGPLPTR